MQRIRENRERRCILTEKRIIEPISRCFAHVLAKGLYPKYRADVRNIVLVYGIQEHTMLDSLIHNAEKRTIDYMLDSGASYEEIEDYILLLYKQKV